MPPGAPSLIISPKSRKDVRITQAVPLYQGSEAAVLNMLAAEHGGGVAPYPYVDVTSGDGAVIGSPSVRTAAWTMLYLYGLINEDRRPSGWRSLARTKLRSLADWLLTQQAGSPVQDVALSAMLGPTADTDTEYGGFLVPEAVPTFLLATVYSEDLGACGLALLRAYQTLGEPRYQEGYRRALTCMRRMQSGGKLSSKYAATTEDGGRYNSGMWTHKLEIRDSTGSGGGGIVNAAVSFTEPASFSFGAASTDPEVHNTRGCVVNWDEIPGTTLTCTLSALIAVDTGTFTLRAITGVALTAATTGTELCAVIASSSSVTYLSASVDVAKPIGTSLLVFTGQKSVGAAVVSVEGLVLTLEVN